MITSSAPRFAYVGSRTTRERNARGEGVSVFRICDNGSLDQIQLVGGLTNPSFLALNRRKDRLYTVHGDGDEVSVFSVSPEDGMIAFLHRQKCGGRNPVHLALDPSERWLIVSDHLGSTRKGGSVLVMPVAENGMLGPVVQRVDLPGMPGPHRKEQPHAKPHFNPFDPSGRFVVVPDKGLDRIFVFRFDEGALIPAAVPWIDTRAGAGPRHLAFHPTSPFAYAVNELDSTVTAYRFSPDDGALAPFQILTTLPDTFVGNNTGSEIEMSADGRTLYASNRGHDSIAVFAVDAESGWMQFKGAFTSEGQTPRFFTVDAARGFLHALNEDSDTIVTFPLDGESGRPIPACSRVACGSPVCMVM
ncbi:MAG: lactonase family protein [Xylophilus ampelinus]